jgi:RNA 3'-terminal phosphate cyclase (ATP)
LAVAGNSRSSAFTCTEMTEHARTNIGVIEKFLPVRFRVERSGAGWRVQIESANQREAMAITETSG